MSPAGIVTPHVEELGVDVVVDFGGETDFLSIDGSTFEAIVLDGDLVDMCVYGDNFPLVHAMNRCDIKGGSALQVPCPNS